MREFADHNENPEVQCLKAELHEVLFEVIDDLEPGLRVVLVMRELGTLSIQEIAQALDVSVPVAKSRLFRARQKLRDLYLRRFLGRSSRKLPGVSGEATRLSGNG